MLKTAYEIALPQIGSQFHQRLPDPHAWRRHVILQFRGIHEAGRGWAPLINLDNRAGKHPVIAKDIFESLVAMTHAGQTHRFTESKFPADGDLPLLLRLLRQEAGS